MRWFSVRRAKEKDKDKGFELEKETVYSLGRVYHRKQLGMVVVDQIHDEDTSFYTVARQMKDGGLDITVSSDYVTGMEVGLKPVPFEDVLCKLPSQPSEYESVEALWSGMEDYWRDHIAGLSDIQIMVSAGFDLATWISELFEYYAFLAYLGPSGSGKSHSLKVHYRLARRALLIVNPSPAVIYRTIEEYKPTTFLVNETDLLAKGMTPEVENILLSGDEAGIPVARVEYDKLGRSYVKAFHHEGFKAFAGTVAFGQTMSNRIVAFFMTKAKPKFRRWDETRAERLRSQALMFRLRILFSADARVRWMKRIDELLVELNLENPRVENIVEPFLWLALESHNPKRLEQVMLFARELDSKRSEAEKTSIDAMVIMAIATLPDNMVTDGKFTTESVTDKLNATRREREWFSTDEVGRLIARFGFEETRVGGSGLRGYRWDDRILDTWAKRFGIIRSTKDKVNDKDWVGKQRQP